MTRRLDLLIRGGRVVTPAGLRQADLGVSEGRIVALQGDLEEVATEEVDARGLTVFPGIVDAHVHFNEPGRTEWEGLATGSAALAAGGGTCFFDMPLNSLPPVLDAPSFEAKRRAAERSSRLDFALWGGLTPGSLEHLDELAEAGAIAFKAFLCSSGVSEFPAVTDAGTLREGMKRAASLGLPVGVHAEDEETTQALTRAARARGEADPGSWLLTRPVEAEVAAIRRALELAGETGCRLHVVHVSSPEGLAAIADARAGGVDVSAETCPHYLLLDQAEVLRQGAPAKCAPPLRDEARRQGLWTALEAGRVDTLGSDHSPAPPSMKTAADFFEVWGGISGCQHGFPLLLSEALGRAPAAEALPRLARLLAAAPAERFGLGRQKGRLAPGYDADLALLDLADDHRLSHADLLYRHRQGPYDGRRCRVRVLRTYSRGHLTYSFRAEKESPTTHPPRGRFLRPES